MASLTELPTLLNAFHHRDFNVEKGREMLSSSLVWRKKHGVDKILSEYQVGRDARPFVGSHSAWGAHEGWVANCRQLAGLPAGPLGPGWRCTEPSPHGAHTLLPGSAQHLRDDPKYWTD